jgi:hypothetical protein
MVGLALLGSLIAALPLVAQQADDDGDGLSDSWEINSWEINGWCRREYSTFSIFWSVAFHHAATIPA